MAIVTLVCKLCRAEIGRLDTTDMDSVKLLDPCRACLMREYEAGLDDGEGDDVDSDWEDEDDDPNYYYEDEDDEEDEEA